MEVFQQLRDDARQKIHIADHMTVMTYKAVNDPKLLIAILDNIFGAIETIITGALEYERIFKRIPPYPAVFEGKFTFFRQHLARKYDFQEEDTKLVQKIRELLLEHKKSPVE